MQLLIDSLYSKYLLWLLLALPAVPIVADFVINNRYYSEMMYDSGVWSVQLLLLALSITPINQLLNYFSVNKNIGRWLLQRRRSFGVFSFVYAVIHLALYLRESGDFYTVYDEALSISLGFAWLAFLLFILLALTSNNTSMKLLGKKWKLLQRLAYIIAVATFIHWLSLQLFFQLGLLLLLLLVLAKVVQLTVYVLRH